MGPTNIALVKLYRAERELREAQERLDGASRSVRAQERKVADLGEKLKLSQQKLREQQARGAELEGDIKARDAKIEKFREQQASAQNHREYQAFLTEINTEKVDKAKTEEQLLVVMEAVEKFSAEVKDLSTQLEAEKIRLGEINQQLGERLAVLKGEVDRLRPQRDATASAVPARARDHFERLSEKFEGEAMAPLSKPDRRREEYVCTSCNMSLVADIYNRLHSRDDLVLCPNCHRLLYIPDDLPPELAVHKPKERKEPARKAEGAAVGRQVSAIDVARSINSEEEETPSDEQPADTAGGQQQP